MGCRYHSFLVRFSFETFFFMTEWKRAHWLSQGSCIFNNCLIFFKNAKQSDKIVCLLTPTLKMLPLIWWKQLTILIAWGSLWSGFRQVTKLDLLSNRRATLLNFKQTDYFCVVGPYGDRKPGSPDPPSKLTRLQLASTPCRWANYCLKHFIQF